jgi:hypothetical protein
LTRTQNKQGRSSIRFNLTVVDVGSDTHDSEPNRIKNFLDLNVVNAILMSLRKLVLVGQKDLMRRTQL